MSTIPAVCLEVEYSEDDLRLLNEEAAADGMTLQQFLRAATKSFVEVSQQKRKLRTQAAARRPFCPGKMAA
jgi:nicotinamide riboside kinase